MTSHTSRCVQSPEDEDCREEKKAELQKLGGRYDFKGQFLKKVTNEQLSANGLLGDQLRGSTSPEADLISHAKSRHARAVDKGYSSIWERFSQDAVFAASLLNEGENEHD